VFTVILIKGRKIGRLMAAMDYFNRDPVVHTWTYKLDKAA
jgi:hypothetical protein